MIALGLAVTVPIAAPAAAKVTFVQAGAYSQTGVGIGRPDTITDGPSDVSTSYGSGYFRSTSDSSDDFQLSQASSSSAGAIQFAGPDSANFFVRSSSLVDVFPNANQPVTHSVAAGSALYYFSIDTISTVLFTGFASPVDPSADANVTITLFSVGVPGMPGTIYRNGYFGGTVTSFNSLVPGQYGFEVDAYSEARTSGSRITNSSVANVLLSINAQLPPLPVPEPATWAMMLIGFGVIGVTARRRHCAPATR